MEVESSRGDEEHKEHDDDEDDMVDTEAASGSGSTLRERAVDNIRKLRDLCDDGM